MPLHHKVPRTLLALLTSLCLAEANAFAETVSFKLSGHIASLEDFAGVLDGSVLQGGTFAGTYTFDASALDENADSTVGELDVYRKN